MDPWPTWPSENGTAKPGADTGPSPRAGSAPVRPSARRIRRLGPIPLDRRTGITAGIAMVVLLAFVWAGTGYVFTAVVERPPAVAGTVPPDERGLAQAVARLRGREQQLQARLKATSPRGVFIVIDQTHNRLYLKKDDTVLLEGICSAGSGLVLKEGGGKQREWVFDTPRGRFEVLSRLQNPVWRKPDWAFVEDGEPIPKNAADRLDYGTLGEYALYFGNGFMIHGTLYERLLGRAVSHGCIRVGRDDLRKVWANTTIGTPIYIY
jgi:L,D-transpeptidase ErfK/SrfK